MAKKETAVANVISEEALAVLRESYPVEQGPVRIMLPRLGMASQDVTEGKGKSMKVTMEAGTFFIEKETDEVNDEGKKIWSKDELGTSVEGIIVFQRRQLRYFDGENYTSSPIYDTDDQVVPLFANKQEVDRGTPTELKARKIYQGVSAKGKPISKLEENRVLYVLHEGELYQMSIRGTSMYAFMTYARNVLPPGTITRFSSEAKENGSIAWSQMTFEAVRPITKEEGVLVQEKMNELREAVAAEKAFYASKTTAQPKSDSETVMEGIVKF